MNLDESHISLRFKHGVHTIYLFSDSTAPFSETTEELLGLLRERYPEGLTTSTSPAQTTKIPDDAKLAFGVLNVPTDASRGWKQLKIEEGQSPSKVGLKENSIIAFAFIEDEEDDDVLFEVEWPKEDEEMYDQ